MLANKLKHIAHRYTKLMINGFYFHASGREMNQKSQNCGVVINATTTEYCGSSPRCRGERIFFFWHVRRNHGVRLFAEYSSSSI